MKRDWDMNLISDGKKYTSSDLARLGCRDCFGCHACCEEMENLIQLDPYDIYQMTLRLGRSFPELLTREAELTLVDGLILPSLKMDPATHQCPFLNEKGRCSIHDFRPGICRLFPLGRIYEEGSFSYFLQINECPHRNGEKIRISSWLNLPDLKKYENYINRWHYLLESLKDRAAGCTDQTQLRNISLPLLQQFYMQPYQKTDFYFQWEARLNNYESQAENR